ARADGGEKVHVLFAVNEPKKVGAHLRVHHGRHRGVPRDDYREHRRRDNSAGEGGIEERRIVVVVRAGVLGGGLGGDLVGDRREFLSNTRLVQRHLWSSLFVAFEFTNRSTQFAAGEKHGLKLQRAAEHYQVCAGAWDEPAA